MTPDEIRGGRNKMNTTNKTNEKEFNDGEKAHLKMLSQRFNQNEQEVFELFKTLQQRHQKGDSQ